MTGSQTVPQQRSWSPELLDFMHFAKLIKKSELLEKFELPDKIGFKLTEKSKGKKKDSCLPPTCIYKLSMMSMVWNISTGQPGRYICQAMLPPSSCTLAH